MLTESEREWLEDRWHTPYCRYCNVSKLCANPFASGYSCPLTGNMKDAAEFESRVAAKLADPYFPSMDKGSTFECGYFIIPSDDRLRCARIQVEEEMDGEA